jgi:8-oxo-dGTP pyrophosphatase MutT (NUDIX family)
MMKNRKKEIEVLVRGIIQHRGKILVCKKIGKYYYFFPGGNIEFGENTKEALTREIKEELGLSIKKLKFIGGSEHLFTEDGKKHHEINLAFSVLVRKINTKSKENHLCFFLMDKKPLARENVLPQSLKKAVLKWVKDKKPLWVSQI